MVSSNIQESLLLASQPKSDHHRTSNNQSLGETTNQKSRGMHVVRTEKVVLVEKRELYVPEKLEEIRNILLNESELPSYFEEFDCQVLQIHISTPFGFVPSRKLFLA